MLNAERFAGINFLMNFVILAVSARRIGRVRWRRTAAVAGAGAVCTSLFYAVVQPGQRSGWLLLSLYVLMGIALFGRQWRGYFCFAAYTAFAGGLMAACSRWIQPGSIGAFAVAALGLAAASCISDGIQAAHACGGRVRLRIATRMGTAELDALVDTGNCIREPVSGLPVVIAGRCSLLGLMDPSCLTLQADRLPPGFRMVTYSGLGGNGEMHCFRPESVHVLRKGRWEEAADLWVAVYQGTLSAQFDALAPPDLMLRAR